MELRRKPLGKRRYRIIRITLMIDHSLANIPPHGWRQWYSRGMQPTGNAVVGALTGPYAPPTV